MMNYAAGRNAVNEALKAGHPIEKILVAKGSLRGESFNRLVEQARQAGTYVQEVDRAKLDEIVPLHQGVIAILSAWNYVELDDMLAAAGQSGRLPLLVILDEVNDPGNLGAVMRSAEVAGADGIVIPKRRSVGLTAAVARSSAGAIEYMPVAHVNNLVAAMHRIKEAGIWVAGAEADAQDLYYEADLNIPLALVLGGESKGLGRLVRQECDLLVRIPLLGRISSLNVSAAAAVLLFEAVRQRSVG
ncbi:MAG: 23S rRNA (guanosine(2251)-2'-O)-methyltransferase RlmB [bacterium]|nr:23S rRNA (guanosine(2251)-2'-O)-methyltransferase RlmB [bacterium]